MGITRQQLFILSILIFLAVSLIGCALLIAFGKIVP